MSNVWCHLPYKSYRIDGRIIFPKEVLSHFFPKRLRDRNLLVEAFEVSCGSVSPFEQHYGRIVRRHYKFPRTSMVRLFCAVLLIFSPLKVCEAFLSLCGQIPCPWLSIVLVRKRHFISFKFTPVFCSNVKRCIKWVMDCFEVLENITKSSGYTRAIWLYLI